MNREEKSETTPPNSATNSPQSSEANIRSHSTLRAKLRFFRTMLWVLIYATGVVFFFSLILLGGFRLQTKIIGGALLACVALVIVTYVLQWRD